MRGEGFLFSFCLKKIFLDTAKFGGICLPVATGLKEALMIKALPMELSETMNDCIHIVKLVNSRIVSLLCVEMGSEHRSLLFHMSVRWVSVQVLKDSSSSGVN